MADWRIKLYRGKYAAVRSINGQTERYSLRTTDLDEAKRRLADYIARPTGDTVGDLVGRSEGKRRVRRNRRIS